MPIANIISTTPLNAKRNSAASLITPIKNDTTAMTRLRITLLVAIVLAFVSGGTTEKKTMLTAGIAM